MFITGLLTIANTWKQPKYPLIEEWIKKMWCIYIQQNTTQPLKRMKEREFAATRMELYHVVNVENHAGNYSYPVLLTQLGQQESFF